MKPQATRTRGMVNHGPCKRCNRPVISQPGNWMNDYPYHRPCYARDFFEGKLPQTQEAAR